MTTLCDHVPEQMLEGNFLLGNRSLTERLGLFFNRLY